MLGSVSASHHSHCEVSPSTFFSTFCVFSPLLQSTFDFYKQIIHQNMEKIVLSHEIYFSWQDLRSLSGVVIYFLSFRAPFYQLSGVFLPSLFSQSSFYLCQLFVIINFIFVFVFVCLELKMHQLVIDQQVVSDQKLFYNVSACNIFRNCLFYFYCESFDCYATENYAKCWVKCTIYLNREK